MFPVQLKCLDRSRRPFIQKHMFLNEKSEKSAQINLAYHWVCIFVLAIEATDEAHGSALPDFMFRLYKIIIYICNLLVFKVFSTW